MHWYPPNTVCTYLISGKDEQIARVYFPKWVGSPSWRNTDLDLPPMDSICTLLLKSLWIARVFLTDRYTKLNSLTLTLTQTSWSFNGNSGFALANSLFATRPVNQIQRPSNAPVSLFFYFFYLFDIDYVNGQDSESANRTLRFEERRATAANRWRFTTATRLIRPTSSKRSATPFRSRWSAGISSRRPVLSSSAFTGLFFCFVGTFQAQLRPISTPIQ